MADPPGYGISAEVPLESITKTDPDTGEFFWNPTKLAGITPCQRAITAGHERAHTHLIHKKMPVERDHNSVRRRTVIQNMTGATHTGAL